MAWTRDARLVRGLDYYRHTAFEFVTDRLGAQGTVLGGGRYDGLIEALGGSPTPGVGWAAGIERLGMMIEVPAAPALHICVILESEGLDAIGVWLATKFRDRGVNCDLINTGSAKKRFEKAKKLDPEFVLIVDSNLTRPDAMANLRGKRMRGQDYKVGEAIDKVMWDDLSARYKVRGLDGWNSGSGELELLGLME